MNHSTIDNLLQRLHALQKELDREIDQLLSQKQELFRYTLERGRVRFEQGIQAWQRQQKIGLWEYLSRARPAHLITAPIVYSVIVPLVLLDIFVTLYQFICFPVYRIPRVVRRDYLIIDRQHLAYLNGLQKLNCLYCGYGNGLIEYVREISARTEQYWCPVKHARRSPDPHRLAQGFIDYGDTENFKQRLMDLRKQISDRP